MRRVREYFRVVPVRKSASSGGEDRGGAALETELVHSGSPASRSAVVKAAASVGAQSTLVSCLLMLNDGCRARKRAAEALASSIRASFTSGAVSIRWLMLNPGLNSIALRASCKGQQR